MSEAGVLLYITTGFFVKQPKLGGTTDLAFVPKRTDAFLFGGKMDAKPKVLTGHRPTGPRHIGHLVGTLKNWARLQDSHDCVFLVADLHVLTTDFAHPAKIRQNTLEIVFDWLAAGIDPARSTIALQSSIPAHSQLAVLLDMITTVGRLQRVPTYKEQVQELHLHPSAGLLNYPVLQAADILAYKAEVVPVGEDQLPHIELTRETAHRFNQLYGETFPEPQPLLSSTPRLPGLDNRTMHTSYGNALFLRDTPEETKRKIMGMYTDPTRIHSTDPGHVEDNPVFTYLDCFDPDQENVARLKEQYRLGKIGDVQVKRYLAEVVNESLAALRLARATAAAHPDDALDILRAGSLAAAARAERVLAEVMEKMGLRTGVIRVPLYQSVNN
jgi:tryptophanyl-tRNA synthetase